MNLSSYKIYYINLDKSVCRREFMEGQFKKLNVPFKRFAAINGKELSKGYIATAKKAHRFLKHYPFLNEGEIGLIASYMKLWDLISNQEEEFAIIFEDDALIANDFFTDLEMLLTSISAQDFVDISGNKGAFKIESNQMTNLYIVPPLRTTGQILGKDAAKRLRANIAYYEAPIDVMLQEVFRHKVAVSCSKKKYVTSNDRHVGGTTIQKKNILKINKVVRELIRPTWQLTALLFYKVMRFVRNYHFYIKRV